MGRLLIEGQGIQTNLPRDSGALLGRSNPRAANYGNGEKSASDDFATIDAAVEPVQG